MREDLPTLFPRPLRAARAVAIRGIAGAAAPVVGSTETLAVAIERLGVLLPCRIAGGCGGAPVTEGIGLGNCRSRLQALCGEGNYRLQIANRHGGGAVVRIELPLDERLARRL
jgi:hypothetical protein